MKTKRFRKSGPHLPVKNLQETLNYYKTVLGFTDEWTFGETDGGIRRDEINLLFDENPDYVELINSTNHRLPLLWFVDNIEEILEEFLKKGISIADNLKEHAYGLAEFALLILMDIM